MPADPASATLPTPLSAPAASGSGSAAQPQDLRHLPGSPGLRRTQLALFGAGLATFLLLYSTQALLPDLSANLHLTPGQASWTVSAASIGLAVAVIPVSALSERFGRTRIMTMAVFAAVAIALVLPFTGDLGTLTALRALQGVALAGLPATAMAFLAEEVHPSALPSAMGLYVAGNSIGGMSGRLLSGVVAGAYGWRAGLAAVAVASLLCAVAFRVLIPRARCFRPGPVNPRALWHTVTGHVTNPLLGRLFALGLLFMTVFGAVYTVLGYRLVAAPFDLPQALASSIFVVYLVGTVASAASARIGARLGRRGALYAAVATTSAGLLLTLPESLPLTLLGLVLITAGFFTGHCVASAAVGRTATHGRAQASALYLAAYYIGNSLGGAVGASAYHAEGWSGTVAVALTAMLLATGVTAWGTVAAHRAVTARA
ncbi:MFS transporter [Streptacidiphilus pinicola]|uniref:MFS transporter n=1 Tax=Streptacidiphilus pinicola TaxID=2219663 RepID=A0A2X0KL76_9ACTN|nr:MFS transporter [Streptacidiphilus pinicola]RAG87420.1 MFS transporter [Streptacidiphilus pinicola]